MPSLSQRYYRAGRTTRAMILQDEKEIYSSGQALFGMKIQHPLVISLLLIVKTGLGRV